MSTVLSLSHLLVFRAQWYRERKINSINERSGFDPRPGQKIHSFFFTFEHRVRLQQLIFDVVKLFGGSCDCGQVLSTMS
jgi:hypothetical protein